MEEVVEFAISYNKATDKWSCTRHTSVTSKIVLVCNSFEELKEKMGEGLHFENLDSNENKILLQE